jgi:LPS-assembly lipoprotein
MRIPSKNSARHGAWLASLLLLLLCSCGFHLRSSPPLPEHLTPLYIQGLERYDQLNRALRHSFAAADIQVAEERPGAAAILTVRDHGLTRKIITVDSRGKATEYALTRKLTIELSDSSGRPLMAERTVGVQRDWIDVGKDGLAGRVEKGQLQQDMHAELAQSILRVLGYALR